MRFARREDSVDLSVLASLLKAAAILLILVLPLAQIALGPIAPVSATGAWNSNVSCTPITVRISDITDNATGTTSFNNSPFSPGITTTVSGGVAKRWLTPGPTPSGWHSPGPACTITNSKGQSQGVFVEIDGVLRASAVYEDSSTSFDATNGGTSYGSGRTFNDHTMNLFDPKIVSNYQNSCTSASDPTCYGRIHVEIDHDWQAAGYCGAGSACDPAALDSQTSAGSTLMDFQGFVYWDGPSCCSAQDHSFSGWELHPLTGWRIHQAGPTASFTFSPTSPIAGQSVTFTGSASGGTSPYTFAWNFGDGATGTGSSVNHAYTASGTYTVTLTVTDSKGLTGTTSHSVSVGAGSSADFSISASPTSLSVQSGSAGTATVSLTSLNAFSGTVSLSSSVSPSGITASLTPTSVALSSGGSGTSTLTVSSSTSGSYTVTVTGTSGSLSHSTSVAVTVTAPTSVLVASDGALGPPSIGTGGGQKLLQDSAGRLIAVYVDSTGRIGLSYANSNPTTSGWSTPVKSATPTSAYSAPSAVLVSLTSLQVFVSGGAGAGVLTQVPVSVQRDSQNNITGFSFGTPSTRDSSGFDSYPSAVLAHNGDILLAWAYTPTTSAQVRSLRWDTATGWTNAAGTSTTPDVVMSDTSSIQVFLPSIIERVDNNNVYLFANRLVGPPSTVAFNKATWNGSVWSWGTANLTYESNTSDGGDDPVTAAWDPVRSLVVVSYGITGSTAYGVFTLDSSDVKTHLDTPSYPVSERGWGEIGVHVTTGDYYLFFMSLSSDDGPGPLNYVRHPAGGSWNATMTVLDSSASNQGLSVRASGTSVTVDLLYVQGTSAPTSIRFLRLSPLNPPNFAVTANPATLTVPAGSTGTSTITASSLFGFSGTVSLSTAVTPTGLTASLSPSSITLSSGGNATSTLTVSSATAGNYNVVVQGVSGSLSRSVTVPVKVVDFSVTAPATLKVVTGLTSTARLNLTSVNGFAGTVTLASSASPSGLTASLSPTSVTLTSGGSGSTTLTLSSTTVGTYTVTVTGTSGSLSHAVTISVSVIAPPDFSVTVNPSTVTFPVGTSGSSTVTLTSLNGFTGSLTLSRTVSPATGLSATCSPTSFTLTSGGTATSSCGFTSSTTGVYSVTVSVTNGTLTHTATITVNVSDFSVTSNPSSQTILVNSSSGTSTITLTSLNGFSGAVNVGVTSTPGLTTSLSQTSLTLTSSGTATSTLSFSSSTIGNYTITVTATSGSLTHSVLITVRVVDFSVTPSTTSMTVFAGQSGTATVTVNGLGGFSGSISLATAVSPAGLTASISPSSVTLTQNGSAASTLTVLSSTGGVYTVTITGTSGGVTHSVQVTINIVDYSITANPSIVGFQSGSSGLSTITLTSLGGFTGNVSLSESVSPSTGLSVVCSPTGVALSSGGSASSNCTFSSSTQGTYTVTVTATSGPLSHTATITVGVGDFTISSSSSSITVQAGSSGTATITVTSVAGFTGTISLSTTTSPSGLTASLSPTGVSLSPGGSASSTLTLSSANVGTYTVNVIGTIGSLSHSVVVTVNVVDFTVSSSPTSLTILRGSSGTSTIQLNSVNGFTGTVTVSATASPSGLTTSVSPSSVALNSGGSASSTLTASSTSPGNYTVTITTTSGSLTHSVQVTVQVVDFSISASPSSLTVPPGSASNSSLTLTSINGLTGSVSLAATVSPSGPTFSLNPSSVSLSASGSATSVLTVTSASNLAPGTYTVTVTATAGTLSHTVTVTVNVPDYSLTASPTTVNFIATSSSTSTLTITSLGGFSGTVTLTAVPSSGSLTASPSPATVSIASGGTGTATLSLSSSTAGIYTVTVTATSGSFTHSVVITVNVQDFGLSTDVSSLSLTAGSSGTVTINLASLNGFAGTVSMSATCLPSGGNQGPRLSLSSSSVSLTSNGSGTDTLTVKTFKRTPAGTYTITITGTSGGVTHSVTVVLTVN